ncbi:unnamed protein product [Rhizoctonia solani]|uniref:Uncharacterized protein n=1 Tax=Rhizoctonia solani TaxID=456999 RepID=A0A8H3AG80_9AGAM|nr:unnamed protein product [Rhizoctonia solani]
MHSHHLFANLISYIQSNPRRHITTEHYYMQASHTGYARYRPTFLALAALSSFVSATWTAVALLSSASNPSEFLIRNNYWTLQWAYIGLHRYALPIVLLNYASFLFIFVLKVVLGWRLEIQIPLHVGYACFGLAYCAQIVVVVLSGISAPDEMCSMRWEDDPRNQTYKQYAEIGQSFCSNWSAAFSTSIISLVARKFPHFQNPPLN